MVKKVKPEKPPAIDKLLIPAVGVVISFVAFYFMKGLNSEVRSNFDISNLVMVYIIIRFILYLIHITSKFYFADS